MARRRTKSPKENVKWRGLTKSEDGVSVNEIVSPEAFRDHARELTTKHGSIDPRECWKAIEDEPEHPVHPAYEWDDGVAGAKYRDDQSRLMVRTIITEVKLPEGSLVPTRAIVSVKAPDEKSPSYQPFVDTLNDMNAMDFQLQQMLSGLVAWRRKWRVMNSIADLAPRLEVIDGVIQELRELVSHGE